MEDNQQPDVTAESSPAIEVPRESAAYAEWRQTGKLPEAAPAKKEDPPPHEKSAAKAEKAAPASEAGDHQERRPRSNAETRLNEILDDLRVAGLSPAELKTFKREAKQEAAAAAKPPATEKTDKPAVDPRAPVKPKESDFSDWAAFEEAKDKYYEDLADYRATRRVEEFQQQQAQQAAQQTLHQQMQDAKGRYGDEAIPTISATARAIAQDEAIAQPVKALLDQSSVMTDVLYVIGSGTDREEILDLMRTNPGQAIRKIVLIEQLVLEELAKGGKPGVKASGKSAEDGAERDTAGKFVKKEVPPEDKGSKAPPPARELSGRGTAPPDEVDGAVKNNDFARFRAAQNDRDMATRRR